MGRYTNSIIVLVSMVIIGGCNYEVPQYANVENNETAYVVPLEGDTSEQVAFKSAEQLDNHKVATKRIRVTRRWDSTGYAPTSGEWIPTIRVITVSRTPTTREWSTEGYGSSKGTNDALWAESSDSVKFSTGFTCTAKIPEEAASTFLYEYNGQSLSQIMDTEVRSRIQTGMAEFAAEFNMDKLREQKGAMLESIREDVVPFFKDKGIEITTLGQFGGFTYSNPEIQDAINAVFVAQQEEEVAAAQLKAQQDKNERLKMEGEGQAQKEIAIADGKAEALRKIAEATAEAASNDAFLEIKRLNVQESMIEKWNGQLPRYQMGSGGEGMGLLMQVPSEK